MDRKSMLPLLAVLASILWVFSPPAFAAENSCLAAGCHSEMSAANQPHPPEKGCDSCHEATQAGHPQAGQKTFVHKPPICLECHPQIQDYGYLHAPVAAGDCNPCHSPHGEKKSNYLIANGKNICYSCHDRVFTTAALFFHGDIQKENCKNCHTTHGSDFPHLLRAAYSTDYFNSFRPETYELCFKCHKIDLLLDPTTSFNTKFRNGSANLHYLHVNRENQGRACKFCHEIHASNQPHLIKETVSFGGWSMPINYQPSENGGSCTPGCHKRQSYDRTQK